MQIKILCVDDQPSNLLALQASLQGFGYQVIEAPSGEAAIERVKLDDFAAILLDVQMPVLDGFQTALRIRQIERSRRTPIIFLTANVTSETSALKGYEAGAVDYMFKPLNIDVLRAKVAVFVDLFRAQEEVRQQARLLREMEARAQAAELAELRRVSERKYQDLVEGIQEGIVWALDPTAGRFTFVSRRAPQITGYALSRWMSDPNFWMEHLSVDDQRRFQGIFAKALAHDGRHLLEHEFRKSDGNILWFRTELHRATDIESGRLELRGMSVDVTLLKETESALRSALRIRDEFLSIASHELKTPITPLQLQMQSFIRLIENGRFESIPIEKLKAMLEISSAQVSKLSRLINQLLDVSRIQGGHLDLDLQELDLSELIPQALELVRHEIDTSGCTVNLELESGVKGQWDRLRIEQILINLITNATRYAAGKPIEISLTKTGANAVIRVQDQGIGIDPRDQERIFERFERAVPLKYFGGLGLGLYISRQNVELHGGSISVQSRPGKGALFTVCLPLAPPAPESTTGQAAPARSD